MKKKSWKTSVLGALVIVFGMLAVAGPEKWRPTFAAAAVASGGSGLVAAKDNK